MGSMGRVREIKLYFFIVLLVVVLTLFLSGCNEADESQPEANNAGITKTYRQGPATVQLRASAEAITTAEQLMLEVEAATDEGFEVKLPEFGETIGRFTIKDRSGPQPELVEESRVRYLAVYHLKPFLPGEYEIPSMTVRFAETGKPDGKSREIETEAMSIRVDSVLPEDAEPQIKAIMPPEPLPERMSPWWLAGMGAALLAGLAGFIGWRRYRRRRNGPEAIILRPAHEIAEEDLQQLLSENLVESGQFRIFYHRLSAIIRHYIENRFGLRAPEQTTEEFLNAMRTADELTTAQKKLLKSFMVHCDQVKFAGYQPAPEEVHKMIDAGRRFISETRPRQTPGSSQNSEA